MDTLNTKKSKNNKVNKSTKKTNQTDDLDIGEQSNNEPKDEPVKKQNKSPKIQKNYLK